MGGNQSKVTVDNLTENLVNSVLETTQSSAMITNISQELLIDTTKYDKIMGQLYIECLKLNRDRSPADMVKSCEKLELKGVSNISNKGLFNISKSTRQTSESIQQNASEIVNKIEAKQKQENSAFSMNQKTKTNIINRVKNVSDIIARTFNQMLDRNEFKTSLVIRSGNVSGVSTELVVNYLSNQLQQSKVLQEAIATTINEIKTDNTQTNSGLGLIIIIIIAVLVLIPVLYFSFRYFMRKKKVNNQNIEKGGSKGNFIPVLIISIISILIIVIIVLSVLYSKKNNSGTTVVVNK
jgi:uncharacterized membrane protein